MLEYESANPGQDYDQKEQAQHEHPDTDHEKHEHSGVEATDFTGARGNTKQASTGQGNSGIVGTLKGARKEKAAEGRGSYDAGPNTESGPVRA